MEVNTEDQCTSLTRQGPLTASGRNYSGAGIKTSVPGTVYQIELLMLFINRGLQARCTFRVATEVASAGAFDDLVFEYETATTNGILFLQAKHRTNLDKKIREMDLVNVVNGDFSVPKYFESYRKIINKKTKEFKGDVKQFVIYTPINIDDDILENFEEVSPSHEFAENGLLYFDPKVLPRVPKFFKIRKDSLLCMKLVALLEKNTERSIVATKLGKTVASKNAIIVEEVLKKHRDWLLEKVLDGDNITTVNNKVYIRFKKTFLKTTGTDDVEVSDFRNVLLQSYLKTRHKYLKNKESETFGSHEKMSELQNIIDILLEENAKFQVAKTYLTSKFKKFKSDSSTRAEIESFFDEFVFATNQPNDEELKAVIKKEIGDMMSLMADISGWVESRLQSCVLDWLKTKKGRFLTNEDCRAFFDKVQQEFASWGQTSSSLANVSHIENCGYSFRTYGNLIRTVRNFLRDDDLQILCICYTNRLLTQIKLCQSRPSNQDFIFGELRKLSLQVGSKMCPVKAFTSHSNNHIFLEIDNSSELRESEINLLQKFIGIVENDTKKRLVVMVEKDQQKACENILVNCIAHLKKQTNYMTLRDWEYNFSDLSDESKEKLLKTATVRFQGRKFSLGTLLDNTLMDRLSGGTLSKLINDNLDLGSAPSDVLYDSVKAYYIERTFVLRKFLKQEIVHQPEFHTIADQGADNNQDVGYTTNPELQMVSYSDLNENSGDRTRTDKRNILVITKSTDTFSKVCQMYKDRNVHWLIREDNFYVWQESQGSLSEIRKWLNTNFKPCNAICEHIDNKITIINAAPGMGKSIVLSHLETNIKSFCPEYFCIRTNLVDHWADLDDLDKDNMINESINFLFKAARLVSEDCNDDICGHITVRENGDLKLNAGPRATFDELLRFSIFCHFYNEGNIFLLLDGFDEISPQYNEQVVDLIQTLKDTKVSKMWITTRPYDLVSVLEDKLSTFSYTLEPLSVEEQRHLLLHFWRTKLKVDVCVTKLIEFLNFLERTIFKHFNKDNVNYMSTFMGIPLHVSMLATIEEKRFLQFLKEIDVNYDEVDSQFSIYTIYNEFFKIKFEGILYKKTDVNAPKLRSIFSEKKKKIMKDNGKLALLELFEDIPEALVCEDDREKLKEEVMIGEEKTGIVYKFADGKPRFVHRTYAEFFAAHFLADTILNSKGYKSKAATKFLYKIITEYTWQTSIIFAFFNYKVVSSSKFYTPLFNSALNGNIQKLLEVENIEDIQDDLGRTPFHLLFCSGLIYNEAIDIFEKYRSTMLVADNLFKWSPLHYAVLFHDCDKTLLYQGHQFVNKSPEPQFRDINGRTPLILASQRNCTERCIYNFIYNFSLEIGAQDNAGKTALHYALCNVNKPQQNRNLKSCLLRYSEFDLIGFYTEHMIDNKSMNSVNHFNVDQLTTLRKKLLTDPGLCSLYHNTCPNLSLLAAEMADTWDAPVNAQDCEGKTALHYAIVEKNWMEVHLLIRQKADVTIRDNKGRIPAYFEENEVLDCKAHETTLFFINSLKPDVMKLLVDNMELSQDVLVQILYRYKNISEYLLGNGLLSASMQDSTGKTGLHHAVIQNNGDGVIFLKNINANPNVKDNEYNMPLQYVTTQTNVEVIIINLLMMGAYFDVVSQEMRETICILKSATDLFDSVKANNLEKLRNVLSSEYSGVIVKTKTKVGGKTALHIAARAGYTDIGRILLLHGACYNAPDDNAITPAHLAQRHNHLAMHDSILTPYSLVDIARKGSFSTLQIAKSREIHRNPFDCDCFECKLRDVLVAVHYMDKAKHENSNQKVTLELTKTGKGQTLQITTETITKHVTFLEFLVRSCRGRDLMVMLRSRDLNNDLKILEAGRRGVTDAVLPMLNRCNCQSDDESSCTCISVPQNVVVVVVVITVYVTKLLEILNIAD